MIRNSIPNELIKAIQSEDVILFLGNSLSEQAGFPSSQAIQYKLAQSLGVSESSQISPEVFDVYISLRSRLNLIRLLQEIYNDPNVFPTDVHSLIVALPIKKWITSNIDNLFERVLQREQKSYQVIIYPEDLPFIKSTEQTIVKMLGDIKRPDSLVVTPKDFADYRISHNVLETWLKAQIIGKTILYIGFNPSDSIFSNISREVNFMLQGFGKMAYAIFPNADDFHVATLKNDNIYCINSSKPTNVNDDNGSTLQDILRELLNSSAPISSDKLPIDYLASEIKEWLKVMGYTIISERRASDQQYDIKAEIESGLLFQRVFVRCFDNEISIPHLLSFHEDSSRDKVSLSWAISRRKIPKSSVEYCQKIGENFFALSVDDFIRKIIDFSPYLDWLEDTYLKSDISNYYTSLSCEKPIFNQNNRLLASDRYDDIDSYIDDWLNTSGKNHISILGNFGSGKTWFCLHYAYRLLLQYRNDPVNKRIPLLISLRDYAKTTDMKHLITDLLVNRYKVSLTGGYQVFQRLNDMGKLLLILDGFDEMARKIDQRTLIDNFWKLTEVAGKNSKVILTCRTTYFRYGHEAEEILSGQKIGRDLIDLTSRPGFEIINILPFQENQIREALSKRLGEKSGIDVFGQLEKIHDLSDLAKRPVMLEMIASSINPILEKAASHQNINVSDLYELYVNQWINKNIIEERTFLEPSSKRFFMHEFAWQMYHGDVLSIHYSEISQRIVDFFGVSLNKELDQFDNDLRTQSFLIRDYNGNYSFAHKSFMEYFVASYLNLVLQKYFNPHSSYEIISEDDPQSQKEPEINLVETFGARRLTPEIELFLAGLRPDPQLLWMAINFTQGKNFDEAKFTGSNAASLLTKLGISFEGKDLSKAVLRDADLSTANLKNANLSRVDGEGLNLQLTNLIGVNFSYSHLHHVMLGDSDVIREVVFSPDGSAIISCGSEPVVRLLDTNTGNIISEGQAHTCIRGMDVAWSDNFIVGGGLDGTIRIWEFPSLKLISSIRAHNYPVYGIAFEPQKKFIATASSDHTVGIWDAKEYFQQEGSGHISKLWDIERGNPIVLLTGHNHHVRSVSFDPTGRLLVSSDVQGLIQLWDTDSWTKIRNLTDIGDPGTFQTKFSPNGEYFAVGLTDNSVKIWETKSWKLIGVLKDHPGFVLSLAFDKSSQILAAGCRDGTIINWSNFQDPQKLIEFKAHQDAILSICFHPHDNIMVSAGGGNVVKLWDVNTANNRWQQNYGGQQLMYEGMNITGVQGIIPHFIQFLIDNGAIVDS